MIWGATFDVIADMQYVGNGSFKKRKCQYQICRILNDPTNKSSSWLTWVEERYYFISTIMCDVVGKER